jgi:hypothetical protein
MGTTAEKWVKHGGERGSPVTRVEAVVMNFVKNDLTPYLTSVCGVVKVLGKRIE